MIKGINHQVIEVTQTENKYYERALLVVRPEYSSMQRRLLEKEAKKLIRQMGVVSAIKPKRLIWYNVVKLSLSTAVGVLVTMLVYSFK